MGDIRIPTAMAQMDGFFGCKVVRQKNDSGIKVNVIKKKDFIDWVFDILVNLESHPFTRDKTVAALDEISEKIKDAETGEFKALVARYKSTNVKIDFREVKKTLATSLSWEFPARVFSRDAGHSCDLTLINAYKEVHLKNLNKSICLEKNSMPLISNAKNAEATDANIQGYCKMLHDIYLKGSNPIPIRPEVDAPTQTRIELEAAKMGNEEKISLCGTVDVAIESLETKINEVPEANFGINGVAFKDIYLKKLRESVDNKPFEVEILIESNGSISDKNIAEFSKARVQMAPFEKSKFKISIPAEAREQSADIQIRLNEAYIAARIDHLDERFNTKK